MRIYQLLALSLAVFFVLSATGSAFAQTVTFDSLLDEMVDRTAVASFPSPAYICKQASSYDRHSVAPDKPGWFANRDRSQFIRSEENQGRKEWVLMDAKGPGAMVRWWVTNNKCVGNIRIYIDGATEPVVTAKVNDLVGGTALVGPPLSAVRARGGNLYLPIPYAKSCKVTFDRPHYNETKDRKDLLYYQINYRTYPADTKVESFTKSTIADAKAKLEKVQEQLLDPADASLQPTSGKRDECTGNGLTPRNTIVLAATRGPGAVCKVSIKLDIDTKDLPQVARSVVLKGTFDDQQTIWCPLSDFFGSGVGVNPYKGWYRQIEKDGTMTCWWIMPYQKMCIFSLENLSKEKVSFTAQIDHCDWTWTDRSMYFHTTWRQERGLKSKGNGPKKKISSYDWNFVTIDGKGVYVGDTLAIWNSADRWWGEGDEKIFVDGEKFPSHFGTGTEDYYGYAWGKQDFFESPFHAQPRSETVDGYKGNTTNTRVRLLDGIPFTTSYHMDMEVWTWKPSILNYAAATYWYGRPGAKANYGPMPEEAKQPVKYKTPKPEKKTKKK
ncbi:MAG: DUF2961 domain-containing protein [Planctomycetia bacterium]|jgi:hypothetical protein